MRLGAYEATLAKGSVIAKVYGTETISERHRHRYEVNDQYISQLEEKGLVFAGKNTELGLVETVEITDHPWFIAVQYHPEFKSKPFEAHPLFKGFVEAAAIAAAKTAAE